MDTTNKPSCRIVIAGGRTFQDFNLLSTKCKEILSDILETKNVIILSGGAKGADQLGERFAMENNLELEYHQADWKSFGKRAGLIRNAQMAENADILIAFWDGQSKGTEHMINSAYQNGLRVEIIPYEVDGQQIL